MRQVPLGSSGLNVGAVAYGCWRFAGTSIEDAREKIACALDHGMTLIDTADIYGFGEPAGFGGAEALLGEVLASTPGLRNRMVLATKGGITPPVPYDSSEDYLVAACEASLKRLKTDAVDLYQIHRPDLLAPVAETAAALDGLVRRGLVRAVGVSNFTVSQTRALQAHLDVPVVTTQPEFSAWQQDPVTDGTLDWASETGAACLAWSPLAGGSLATGRCPEGTDETRFHAVIAALDRLAEAHDATRSAIALAFTLRHPANVIPIIGTQNKSRIADAAAASMVRLSRRDWYGIVEARRGLAMP